jgi:hypothetical protein
MEVARDLEAIADRVGVEVDLGEDGGIGMEEYGGACAFGRP